MEAREGKACSESREPPMGLQSRRVGRRRRRRKRERSRGHQPRKEGNQRERGRSVAGNGAV